jgi:coenzyme PQQ precursor peptide PqqA
MEAGRTGLARRAHGIPWPAFPPIEEVPVMKWETPEARDTRFGFEITMYISTR